MQIREDIETEIEDCQEKIFKLRYKLRWFHFGARIFWIGLVVFLIDAGILIIISPLNIPFLQPALENIAMTP